MNNLKSYRLYYHTEHTITFFGQNARLPNAVVGGIYLPLNITGLSNKC